MRKILIRYKGEHTRERVNVRMFECSNGGLEGLGGLEFRGKSFLSACGAACKREEKFRACED